ncbi:MAG: hypothetical protein LKI88_00740 [Bifidobacterium sp.]|jgi:hypothetical protein|nr:hypothetical protein [Bifidobacterium sp.]MCI1864457.1 hypothetical protein [Bifidobacterium sp.]
MTQEYIPTDEDVRHDYWSLDYPEGGYDFDVEAYEKERAEDFDRWLADHDAQIRADAWEEGFTEGRDLAVSGQPMTRNNPYKRVGK